tara:strand:- start:1328 stop:1654 length:327 start_codon:yes stop_codon:yes gene_type:complete
MGTHDNILYATAQVFYDTSFILGMIETFNRFFFLWFRVEDADGSLKPILSTGEELSVRLDRVHGDDEMDCVRVPFDILQADESLSFLRFPDDGIEVLLLILNVGHFDL